MNLLNYITNHALITAIAVSLFAFAYSIGLAINILSKPRGDEKMNQISDAITEGANAYMKKQYTIVALIGVLISAILYYFLSSANAIGFLIGALLSAASGIIGMSIAVRSNIRVAQAAKSGLSQAFSLAFKGGAVTGLIVGALALLSVSGFYLWLLHNNIHDLKPLIALGFGGSLISIFAR